MTSLLEFCFEIRDEKRINHYIALVLLSESYPGENIVSEVVSFKNGSILSK